MTPLKLTLTPLSPFGTHLKGDTLFGQLCWAVRHRFGEARLTALLQGYTEGRPFAIVSDAFPAGFLPRPALPLYRFHGTDDDRKRVRKRRWIPVARLGEPVTAWLAHGKSDHDLARHSGTGHDAWQEMHLQPHNTINRATGTTGRGEFAPYGMPQHWFASGVHLEVHLLHDAERITAEEMTTLFRDLGLTGFGRDASIGLGKFDVTATDAGSWPGHPRPDAWLTLAPCAPQGLGFDTARCWYQPFTRFGRHGDQAVHSGRPFKNPVLLADTGALLKPVPFQPTRFTGQGLGGDGSLSKAIAATVHQGYAPVIPVRLEDAS